MFYYIMSVIVNWLNMFGLRKPVTTPANMRHASLFLRVIAATIDGILVIITTVILWFLYLLLIWLLIGVSPLANFDENKGIAYLGVTIIIILNLAYFSVMESSSKQATLGKILAGIVVVNREGNRLSFWRSVLRNSGKAISVATYFILVLISCFTIALTQEKQALHDIVAGSHVIIKN